MNNMRVPFLDLVAPHLELEDELVEVFRSALLKGAFVGGKVLEDFERAFADFCGAGFAVGVASGTDALRFALLAAGIGPGQTVVTVPNTFIATAEAITQAGAEVDFVDINPQTYNLDPVKLNDYFETKCRFDASTNTLIHSKTRNVVTAIVPVHLYGQPADMDSILGLAARYRLAVIEDACQAHGAEYLSRKEGRWWKVGSMARAAAFSFYPGKNLGACGEGGAVTTNDEAIAKKVKMLRDHGQAQKYYHEIEGTNGRLDAIQAGILLRKLAQLPEWNRLRREKAAVYRELLASADLADGPGRRGLVLPFEPDWAKAVYHLFVVRVPGRDELIRRLAKEGIGTGIHYPIPLHLQKAYQRLGYRKGDLPVAEQVASEVLSLPMYPQITLAQQRYVADQVINSRAELVVTTRA